MSKSKKNIRPAKVEKHVPKENASKPDFFLIVVLVVITYFCFSNAFQNDFTNWDDNKYVTNNPLIKSLSFENVKKIFSTTLDGNYHPFTVLSLAIDYHFNKLDPGGFHASSIILHILNVILVFIFIRLLSGKSIVAFITALLFGIHPMHVESVAWVAERKDVLYVFFYIASLCMFVLYRKRQERKWLFYLLAFLLFIFSLLSKGQAVTLPIALLLIDYFTGQKINKKIIFEKTPFLVVSVAMGIVALIAQKSSGAIADIPVHPFVMRILFASASFLTYIIKMVVPFSLSAFYPYPDTGNLPFYYYISPVIIIALIYFMFRLYKKNKSVVWGIGFYVVNILLLLQLIPVGDAIISERYSYLSYVGLFFIVGDGIQRIWDSKQKNLQFLRYVVAFVFFVYVCFMGSLTRERNKVWKNDETLWNDVIKKRDDVALAYLNRGNYYQLAGKFDLAMTDYDKAIGLRDDYYEVLISRCGINRMNGNYDQVIKDCNKAITINKNKPGAYINRGIAKSLLGKSDEALSDFNMAISLNPENSNAYTNRGVLLFKMEQTDAAINDYSKSISLNPEYGYAYFSRGGAFLKKKDFDSAILDFTSAINLKYNNKDSYFYRSMAYNEKKDYANALNDVTISQQLGMPVDTAFMADLRKKVSR